MAAPVTVIVSSSDPTSSVASSVRNCWVPTTSPARWYAKRTNNTNISGISASGFAFGYPGNVPVIGDFDSDNRADDMAVYDWSTGLWNAIRTNNTMIMLIDRLSDSISE